MKPTRAPRLHRADGVRRGEGSEGSERGVAALEFALVFPLLFLLTYGLMTFGLILITQHTLTLAAAEGARAALRYSTDPGAAACAAANQATHWLAGDLLDCVAQKPAPTVCPYDSTRQCMRVTVIYPYGTRPLVPTLPLIGLALPNELRASAMVQLEPALSGH
ncbi:TadE family protein [Chitinasiproducens palmae]|uniref:TadE-like protein n=1 Tax=Chitinasiproducens palmae TaxID=1770053 RepID=A0A1H2PV61_9BURK|nr:TadE family protein [Chitinasiproducens palmae]SDV51153.1 TadE-like protein [Chitinasiproducens palmae]